MTMAIDPEVHLPCIGRWRVDDVAVAVVDTAAAAAVAAVVVVVVVAVAGVRLVQRTTNPTIFSVTMIYGANENVDVQFLALHQLAFLSNYMIFHCVRSNWMPYLFVLNVRYCLNVRCRRSTTIFSMICLRGCYFSNWTNALYVGCRVHPAIHLSMVPCIYGQSIVPCLVYLFERTYYHTDTGDRSSDHCIGYVPLWENDSENHIRYESSKMCYRHMKKINRK